MNEQFELNHNLPFHDLAIDTSPPYTYIKINPRIYERVDKYDPVTFTIDPANNLFNP